MAKQFINCGYRSPTANNFLIEWFFDTFFGDFEKNQKSSKKSSHKNLKFACHSHSWSIDKLTFKLWFWHFSQIQSTLEFVISFLSPQFSSCMKFAPCKFSWIFNGFNEFEQQMHYIVSVRFQLSLFKWTLLLNCHRFCGLSFVLLTMKAPFTFTFLAVDWISSVFVFSLFVFGPKKSDAI